MSNYMDRITALPDRERRSLIYCFAGLDNPAQLKIIQRQNEFINQKRSEMTKGNRAEFYLATLVLAIHEWKSAKAQCQSRLASPHGFSEIDAQRLAYLKQRHPKSPNKDFLVRNLALLQQLRQQGLSWRLMHVYLKQYHTKDISPSYIRTVLNQFSEP